MKSNSLCTDLTEEKLAQLKREHEAHVVDEFLDALEIAQKSCI